MEQFLHANERKFSNAEPPTISGPTLQEVPAESNTPRFASFVNDLIGVENFIPNPSPDCGGLQQTTTGGFLNVHPHFTVHPYWVSWQRRVNLPLSFKQDRWRPENGGDLELWNADLTQCVEKITPDTNSNQAAGRILANGDRYIQRRRGGR